MSISNKDKAFTLIELLVVIAIISILMAIVMTNLMQAKGKSRDAKRVSDIAQLQLALEIFFDRCNKYPVVSGTIPKIDDSCSTGTGIVKLSDFISQIPNAPSPGNYEYSVKSDWSDYILKATLESANNSVVDRYTGTVSVFLPTISCSPTNPLEYCVVPR